MRALTVAGSVAAAVVMAAVAGATFTEGAVTWHENWADAAKAAKAKGCIVFVYVHRLEPH
jgi:hypothetical protein